MFCSLSVGWAGGLGFMGPVGKAAGGGDRALDWFPLTPSLLRQRSLRHCRKDSGVGLYRMLEFTLTTRIRDFAE